MRAPALVALSLALLAGSAAAQQGISSARSADGRTLFVRFSSDLEAAPTIGQFRLLDVTDGVDVPLADAFDTTEPACKRINRLCIPLKPSTPALQDAHEYVLRTGEVKLLDGKVAPFLLSIPPVKGTITGERALVDSAQDKQFVFARFSQDLAGDTVADPQVRVNGVPVRIINPRRGSQPLCYRTSDFDFSCEIDRLLHDGDVVTFRLVDRKNPATVIDDSFGRLAVERRPPEKEADARLRLQATYSRQNGDEKGSLALLVRDCRLATGVRICPVLRFGGLDQPLEGWIRPYADLLLTTEDDGHYDLGIQFQSYLYDVPFFNMIDLRVTPRRESAQGGELSHWMYGDVEARLYVPRLQAGRLLGGFYNLIPRVGWERGSTDNEPDGPRIEASDPERWKAGASFALDWAKGQVSFLPNGGTVSADWTAYSIREDPDYPNPPKGWLHYVTATATLKLAPNIGLSLIRRTGRQAPVFTHASTFELGFTFLQ